MNWTGRTNKVKVGDQVAYSKAFLQSIACYTGDLPQARGRVVNLLTVGKELTLAEIEWDRPDIPGRVNVQNLVLVNERQFER